MAALSKPTNGINSDYANRIGLLFDAFNNGNYQFPATQVPSADANTLDDYEEGTWTPALGGTATYTRQDARYTKIGREVRMGFRLTVNVIGTGSATTISGAPFTNNATVAASGHVGYFGTLVGNFTFVSAFMSAGSASITMSGIGAAGTTMTGPASVFGNSTDLFASMSLSV